MIPKIFLLILFVTFKGGGGLHIGKWDKPTPIFLLWNQTNVHNKIRHYPNQRDANPINSKRADYFWSKKLRHVLKRMTNQFSNLYDFSCS